MACLPPTNSQGKKSSDREIAAGTLGLCECTYRRIAKVVNHKRESLESSEDDKETAYSQILKSKAGPK